MPRPWFVNIFITDDIYKKYHNRKVYVDNPVAKERNAKYIVMIAREELEPIELIFGKCGFFQSAFFCRVFAYTLAFWVAVSLIGII